jgi:hypothetical protein
VFIETGNGVTTMSKTFTQDNTSGYSDAELAALNVAYEHKLAIALGEGAEALSDDTLAQIEQSVAEAVLADYRVEG